MDEDDAVVMVTAGKGVRRGAGQGVNANGTMASVCLYSRYDRLTKE